MASESAQTQLRTLLRGCADVISEADLAQRLGQRRPLRVKLGIDPSGPFLHLGHAVVLRKLRAFQDLGHEAVLIVGDFTGQIGDPTGRPDARKPRTREEIEADMRTYVEQAGMVIDVKRATIRYNSEWLAKLSFADLIGLCARVTVAQLLQRDDFAKRFEGGGAIGVHEFLYPLSQAYDSVAVQADVELGGTEQLFNLMMGRRLQEELGQAPQICMTMPILEGTDGVARMGKSLNNFIALQESPEQMFGQVMSLPDAVLPRYWRLASGAPEEKYEQVERDLVAGTLAARDAKRELAEFIVALYHGAPAATAAREHFEKTVVRKELPDRVPDFALPMDAEAASVTKVLVLVGFAPSNREAQRLVAAGAVRIDGRRVEDARYVPSAWHGCVLQKGNHQFVRIVLAPH